MNSDQGLFKFSYKGNEVQSIKDLPVQDYEELLESLIRWKRKVSQVEMLI
ncbi:hypothetical protein [Bacillus sp. 1P06AnD]